MEVETIQRQTEQLSCWIFRIFLCPFTYREFLGADYIVVAVAQLLQRRP